MSSQNTTDNRFKKATQTVGANGNDVTGTDSTLNDQVMGQRAPGNAENLAGGSEHNSKIERDLQEKGFSNRTSDETLEEASELKSKLDKRGNPPQ